MTPESPRVQTRAPHHWGTRASHTGPGREASWGKEEPRRKPSPPSRLTSGTPTQSATTTGERTHGRKSGIFSVGKEPSAVHDLGAVGRGCPLIGCYQGLEAGQVESRVTDEETKAPRRGHLLSQDGKSQPKTLAFSLLFTTILRAGTRLGATAAPSCPWAPTQRLHSSPTCKAWSRHSLGR